MKGSVLSHDTILDCMFLFVTGSLVTDGGFKTLPSKVFRCVKPGTLSAVRCTVVQPDQLRLTSNDAACHGGPQLCPGSAVEGNWSFSLGLSARVSLYSVLRWSHVSNVTHWFLACRVSSKLSDSQM